VRLGIYRTHIAALSGQRVDSELKVDTASDWLIAYLGTVKMMNIMNDMVFIHG